MVCFCRFCVLVDARPFAFNGLSICIAGEGPCDDEKNFRSTENWLQESHPADKRLNLTLSDGSPLRCCFCLVHGTLLSLLCALLVLDVFSFLFWGGGGSKRKENRVTNKVTFVLPRPGSRESQPADNRLHLILPDGSSYRGACACARACCLRVLSVSYFIASVCLDVSACRCIYNGVRPWPLDRGSMFPPPYFVLFLG